MAERELIFHRKKSLGKLVQRNGFQASRASLFSEYVKSQMVRDKSTNHFRREVLYFAVRFFILP